MYTESKPLRAGKECLVYFNPNVSRSTNTIIDTGSCSLLRQVFCLTNTIGVMLKCDLTITICILVKM